MLVNKVKNRMGLIGVRTLKCLSLALLSVTISFPDNRPTGGTRTAAQIPPAYVLQADDEITVHSLQAKEITDKTFRIDPNGEINFPLVGVLHLGGSTVREAENILAMSLKKYYFTPDVAINVSALHIESVSVLGSVGTPGVYQLKGQTHLLEALSAAGGVRGDAGPVAIVTRQDGYGPIPVPDARQTLAGESVVQVDLKSLMEAQNSSENFLIEPHDVISVPAAQLVYVVGRVKKAGGFALGGRPSLSVVQALALAEGFDPLAAPERARILRRGATLEQQIPVDMKKVLAGKAEDILLHPNDILYVPNSFGKALGNRGLDAAIGAGAALAVFH